MDKEVAEALLQAAKAGYAAQQAKEVVGKVKLTQKDKDAYHRGIAELTRIVEGNLVYFDWDVDSVKEIATAQGTDLAADEARLVLEGLREDLTDNKSFASLVQDRIEYLGAEKLL